MDEVHTSDATDYKLLITSMQESIFFKNVNFPIALCYVIAVVSIMFEKFNWENRVNKGMYTDK